MAQHAAHHEPKPQVFNQSDTGGWPLILLGGTVLGIVVSLIYAIFWRNQFAFSWLFAFMYFFTLTAGALFWVCVHHATDAEWSVVVRRVLEQIASLVPIALLFLIPAILCARVLWSWWGMDPAMDEILEKKHGYLNHTFFLLRYLGYLIALGGIALSLRSNSIRQDADGHPRYTISNRKLAVAGIPLFAVSLTFGAVDWLMGLDYKWFSTMWGVYIFAGAAGSSMSLLVLIITGLRSKGYLKDVVTMEHYHIMGKWMLAFTIFWAYIGFSQYMLIWYANMPEETEYFIRRNIAGWHLLSTILVVCRFFVPLPLLLLQWTKKVMPMICSVAGLILVMQMLDLYIIIMPILHKTGVQPSLADIFALLAIGCPLAFLFLRRLSSASLFPTRDPRLPESLRLTN
jgi:hypothetical protein